MTERTADDPMTLEQLYEVLRRNLEALREHEDWLVRLTSPELGEQIRQFCEAHERQLSISEHDTGTNARDRQQELLHHRIRERDRLELIQIALRKAEASLASLEKSGHTTFPS